MTTTKAILTLNLDTIIKKGEYLIVHRAIQSFTNPKNINKKTIEVFKISNCKPSNN